MRRKISVFLLEGKKEAIREVAEWGIRKVVVSGAVATTTLWQIIFSFLKEAAKIIKHRKREMGIFTVPYQREIYP